MRIDVLTLFPEMFASPLGHSIVKRAQEQGLVEIVLTNIRDFAIGEYRKVDDKPYGGGPGMVMMPGPVFDCFEHVQSLSPQSGRVILLTPQGVPFKQAKAAELSAQDRLILIAGRYEGFDERIRIGLGAEQISIGDYVLTGGELPALVLIDVLSRFVPDVLGNRESARQDSFSAGLLEHPQYTRPRTFRDWEVPELLLSGNHREIETWRRTESLRRTALRKPELLERANLTDAERQALSRWLEEENGKGDLS